ncbi:MAG: septation protein A [Gammaproteobacteria bacterium]|nr:septation protein A [Gammaproteobacteria bacterium]
MKQLIDFLPLLAFFGFYQYTGDIVFATGVLIIATLLQVGWMWLRYRRVERMHLITLVLVVLFGGLTVWLQDDTFIKWKPTILYGIFAAALLISEYALGKNLIKAMLSANIQLPDPVWRNLNLAWALFFVFGGTLNLYVAYAFSQETWVNFKVFGLLALTLVFAFAQMLVLSKYVKDSDEQDSGQ